MVSKPQLNDPPLSWVLTHALALAGCFFKCQGSLLHCNMWQFLSCRSLRTVPEMVSFCFVMLHDMDCFFGFQLIRTDDPWKICFFLWKASWRQFDSRWSAQVAGLICLVLSPTPFLRLARTAQTVFGILRDCWCHEKWPGCNRQVSWQARFHLVSFDFAHLHWGEQIRKISEAIRIDCLE